VLPRHPRGRDHRHGAGFCRLRALIRLHQATVQRLDDRLELAHAARRRFEGIPRSRPLEMDLRYTSRATHPTAGSKLYELDGVAVSVAPDATVYVRLDSKDEMRIDRSDASRARVQKHGRPISAREFAALRRKPTGVTAARRSAASNGVKGWRGEPWLNQKLRPSLHPRAKHAPVFVQHGGRKSPREYAHCIAGQGIGLLAHAFNVCNSPPLPYRHSKAVHDQFMDIGSKLYALVEDAENRRDAARHGADRSAISRFMEAAIAPKVKRKRTATAYSDRRAASESAQGARRRGGRAAVYATFVKRWPQPTRASTWIS